MGGKVFFLAAVQKQPKPVFLPYLSCSGGNCSAGILSYQWESSENYEQSSSSVSCSFR